MSSDPSDITKKESAAAGYDHQESHDEEDSMNADKSSQLLTREQRIH